MSGLTFDPQPVNRTAYNCWFFRGDKAREDCVLVDVLHDGRIHVCSTRFNAHSAAHERVVYEWAKKAIPLQRAEAQMRQAFHEALTGQTYDIETLWDKIEE